MPREKITPTVTVRKRAPRKPATPKAANASGSAIAATRFVDPKQRLALIAEAAFFRAEKRGFAPGGEREDWLAAEAEVDAKLLRSALSGPGTNPA